uniref:Transmembrane protein n=1 Tax=Anopheles maculatus TaxID=74869 RepID=A0A182S6Y0_9DIPT
MLTVPIRIGRLRERRISVLASWCSVSLLVVAVVQLPLAKCVQERTGSVDAERLSPFPGSNDRALGGRPSYATYNTQSPSSSSDSTVAAAAADRNAAPRLNGNEQTNQRESVSGVLDRLDPNQADLVLPSYETSSVRTGGAGLPPVYKYTDNVFRVAKRKAKIAHPEAAAATSTLPRKSHTNRSVGTGRSVVQQADAAWSSSAA